MSNRPYAGRGGGGGAHPGGAPGRMSGGRGRDGSGRSHQGGSSAAAAGAPPPKKESILELQKLQDATVRVKCIGGRELQGILRGYDDLVNLVLEDCDEFLRGEYEYTPFLPTS